MISCNEFANLVIKSIEINNEIVVLETSYGVISLLVHGSDIELNMRYKYASGLDEKTLEPIYQYMDDLVWSETFSNIAKAYLTLEKISWADAYIEKDMVSTSGSNL